MKKAQYPTPLCREAVWSEFGQAYHCELGGLHRGPHASLSVAESVRVRDAWEAANPGWENDPVDLDSIS